MDISQQIEAVYRRALILRQYATELPVSPDLLEKALQELYFVLEELKTSQEELHQQNQILLATQQTTELERQRYQTLFELAPNGYVVTNLQGNIRRANQYAATQLFEIPQEYLINKPLLVLIHPSDRPKFQMHLANLPFGQPWEANLISHSGKVITAAISVAVIREIQQQQEMLIWSFHDITLQKQMERQLQVAQDELEQRVIERTAKLVQANQRLQQEIDERQQAEQKIRSQAALLDIATDAIFVQDLNQRIVFWNQGAERIYGWTAAEVLEKPANLLFPPGEDAQLAIGFAQTIDQGAWEAELNHVTQTGEPIIVNSRWTLVRDEMGYLQSILVVNTDITQKKQLEAQFYRAQRIQSLGSIANGIAHDLNNIFSPILGFADWQLMRWKSLDKPSPEDTYEAWQVVKENARQGIDLVQQIMLFAQGTSGRHIPIKIGEILSDVSKIVRRTFPKTIEICAEIPDQLSGEVAAEPTQLYQVIMNLCVNARDAMPDGGTLRLAVENRYVDSACAPNYLGAHIGLYIMITVSDTGLGIPPHLMKHVFEPFFTTKPSGKGTGLGLATVFSIVKNHGGFIELSSQEGKGTQFRVYLPMIETGETSSFIA